MPTLLQINVFGNKGSHGKIAESIGILAIEHGWRSLIAYGRAANPSVNELIRVGNNLDIREHVLESRLFDNHGLASRKATRRFIKQIEELKPDIIQLHVIHGYYLNYKILFEYLNSIDTPVVWTFHDTWAYTGHCGHYGSISCAKWKTQCGACPLMWKDYPKSIIDRSSANYELKKKLFTANKNLHIVTVSEWLKNEVEQSFFQGKDIRVINNGVDLSVFHPIEQVKEKGNGDVFHILGVASQWGPLKGFKDFMELRKLLPEDKYKITLVGLNEIQLEQLPDGIEGIKRTDSVYQLAELYSKADVFCNLTYADTFPTTNIEALACGTPVITYRTGGSPEILDAETGFVFEKGDINSVTHQIVQLSRLRGEEVSLVSEKCIKRAKKYYDSNSCFLGYISLYNSELCVMRGGRFIILGVSAVWGPVKGLEDYIRLSQYLEPDEIIVLVGVTNEQRKSLPQNIIGLPKTDSVKYLVQLYNMADVTCSLSKAETFGLTIAESFACGTPAIVYNRTALPDLITEETGAVVEAGDMKGLRKALTSIKIKGKKDYSSKCIESANLYYNQKQSYLRYINLYEELLHE